MILKIDLDAERFAALGNFLANNASVKAPGKWRWYRRDGSMKIQDEWLVFVRLLSAKETGGRDKIFSVVLDVTTEHLMLDPNDHMQMATVPAESFWPLREALGIFPSKQEFRFFSKQEADAIAN